MAYARTGTTIIDELKICYIAKETILQGLREIEWGEPMQFGDSLVYKSYSKHFNHSLDICISDIIDSSKRIKVATARFDRKGEVEDTHYFFLQFENHVLYKPDLIKTILELTDILELEFYHFTSIDIAIDVCKNIPLLIKRLIRDTNNTTIINGKAVRDKKATIKNLTFVYSTTLKRLKDITIYIKQAKAANNKNKGITVQFYNKKAEIQNKSNKNYIIEFYGKPRYLFRTEVHLNATEINEYCNKNKIAKNIDLIFNRLFLSELFYYYLSSVIRFTKGRKKLSWCDLLISNDRA